MSEFSKETTADRGFSNHSTNGLKVLPGGAAGQKPGAENGPDKTIQVMGAGGAETAATAFKPPADDSRQRAQAKQSDLRLHPWTLIRGIENPRRLFFRLKQGSKLPVGKWAEPETNFGLDNVWTDWGLRLSSAGLIVIDDDLIKHPELKGTPEYLAAEEWLNEKIIKQYAPPYVTTPSGGRHFIFKNPEKLGQTKRFDILIDIKSGVGGKHGGYIKWYGQQPLDLSKLPALKKSDIPAPEKKKKKALIGGEGRTNELANAAFGPIAAGASPEECGRRVKEAVAAYQKNPGKTPPAEFYEKANKSIQDGLVVRPREADPPLPEREAAEKAPEAGGTIQVNGTGGATAFPAEQSPGKLIKFECHDRAGLFPAREISIITGEKAALKTTGVLSYIAENPFAYYSAGEQKRGDVLAKITALSKDNGEITKGNYHWIDFDKSGEKDFWKQAADYLKKHFIKHVFLDPAPGFKGGIDDSATREFLRPYAELAAVSGAAVLIARSFSKTEYSSIVHRITGSAAWSAFSRAAFGVHQCEVGSTGRPNPQDPKASILVCLVRNVGPDVKSCLKLIQKTETIDADDGLPMQVSVCSVSKHEPDGGDFESLWKKPPEPDFERLETNIHFILSLINEKKSVQSGCIVDKALAASLPPAGRGLSKATVFRVLGKAIDDGLISKAGKAPEKVLYSITEKGKEALDK